MSPPDREARRRAVTETGRNVVVSAGAGTGKTSLIVERLLVALGRGSPLGSMAAITFTEKAAGELRLRLAEGLDELAGRSPRPGSEADRALTHLAAGGVDAATIAARAHFAASRLDRATVTTIHGFCTEILRSHPIDAELPPGFQVDRGPASARAAREEWERFVGEELGPTAPREDLWRRALTSLGLSDLETIGRDLARGQVPTRILQEPYRAVDLTSTLGAGATRLAAEIRTARGATIGVTDAQHRWIEQVLALLEAAGGGQADVARLKAKPSFKSERLDDLAKEALALLRAAAGIDEAAVATVVEAVRPYACRLRDRLDRAGLVDFDRLLVATRDLLRDRAEVREKLKGRFTSILVDEFQDTDPLQYEIVFYLAEIAGESASDAWSARLAPGRLFIVGDAKQSIYRFRGADYAAYRRAVERVLAQGGVALTLSANFRSVPGIVEPVNAIGRGWRPSAYLPEYEPIAADKSDAHEPAVEIWTTPAGSAAADDRRRGEARVIAAEITALKEKGARYADVLVLMRSFSNVSLYLRELREAGIPFVASGGKTFYERTEIVQALGVLRAVADAGDPIARLAYLRSPAGGVPDAELARSAAGGPHPAATPVLVEADRRLSALRAEIEALPVDVVVRHVLERTGLLALNGVGFEGAQRVANLEKLASDASEFARDGRISLTDLLDALEDRPLGEEEGDSPLADEKTEAVRVMTIHKAKGLEAPIVILADAAAGRRTDADRTWTVGVVRGSGDERLTVSGRKLTNTASVIASLEDRRHEDAEDVRLLYVALTRARDRLVVLAGTTNGRTGPWMDALQAWGYDAKLPPADGADLHAGAVRFRLIDPPAAPPRPVAGIPEGAPAAVDRYGAAVRGSRGAALRSPSAEAGSPAAGTSPVDADLARAVGIAVHEHLAGMVIPSRRAEAVGAMATEIIERFEGSPLASRLASMEVLGREIPILLHDAAGSLWRGSIDLLARDPDGTLVVVDYKTDAEAEGAIERHRAQLSVYAESVHKSVPGCRVRAEVWMLRHGTFFEAVRL
jgi:ATP-dependent helicase/nuclease subunit A